MVRLLLTVDPVISRIEAVAGSSLQTIRSSLSSMMKYSRRVSGGMGEVKMASGPRIAAERLGGVGDVLITRTVVVAVRVPLIARV